MKKIKLTLEVIMDLKSVCDEQALKSEFEGLADCLGAWHDGMISPDEIKEFVELKRKK